MATRCRGSHNGACAAAGGADFAVFCRDLRFSTMGNSSRNTNVTQRAARILPETLSSAPFREKRGETSASDRTQAALATSWNASITPGNCIGGHCNGQGVGGRRGGEKGHLPNRQVQMTYLNSAVGNQCGQPESILPAYPPFISLRRRALRCLKWPTTCRRRAWFQPAAGWAFLKFLRIRRWIAGRSLICRREIDRSPREHCCLLATVCSQRHCHCDWSLSVRLGDKVGTGLADLLALI